MFRTYRLLTIESIEKQSSCLDPSNSTGLMNDLVGTHHNLDIQKFISEYLETHSSQKSLVELVAGSVANALLVHVEQQCDS